MQCPSCRAVYSNGLSFCPRCKTPASESPHETETNPEVTPDATVQGLDVTAQNMVAADDEAQPEAVAAPANSTLIEFPGVSRAARPQWRKDLSERVRQIQERRARESTHEVEATPRRPLEKTAAAESAVMQLGLVPQPKVQEVNPIVAAALKRLERARQPSPAMPRPRANAGRGAATAAARVTEEQYETDLTPELGRADVSEPVNDPVHAPTAEALPQTKTPEQPRDRPLTVVPAQQSQKAEAPAVKPPARRVVAETVDVQAAAEAVLPEQTREPVPGEEIYDDRAPLGSRLAASLVDLLVIAFASSPFAAIMELTNGNWSDWRVLASMGGVFVVVMFLYLTASTALAGRTWGMSLSSLRAVDADTGLPPTTRQSVGRALLYIISLATLGLGLLYALFDAEGRTVHDHLSGTIVVRD